MRGDWENNGGIYFFDQYTFQQCWSKIWKLIKIQPVKDILMRYRLVEDPDDFYAVSSPHLSPKQRADNLLSDIVPKAGDYGHYLLYIAIRESIPSNPLGHIQAIEELKAHGKKYEKKTELLMGITGKNLRPRPFHRVEGDATVEEHEKVM